MRLLCGLIVVCLLFLLLLLISDAQGMLQAQQQAEQVKAQFASQLRHCQEIGVPAAFLRPLLQQEQHADGTSDRLTILPNQLVEAYYQRQAQHYRALLAEMLNVVTRATAQLKEQARAEIEKLQKLLSYVGKPDTNALQIFADRISQEQIAFTSAQQPGEYVAISADAQEAFAGLKEMARAFQLLKEIASANTTMKLAHLDTMSVQFRYQKALRQFQIATHLSDFQTLNGQLIAQRQQIAARFLQEFPAISVARLKQFEVQVQQLQTYAGESKNAQERLRSDQKSAAQAYTVAEKLAFFRSIDADSAALHAPLVRGQAHYLLQQFQREVEVWGKAHLYYNSYDGQSYRLNSGYMRAGLGGQLTQALAHARTTPDFERVIQKIEDARFNLSLFEKNAQDQTVYNQVHTSDLQLLQHYGLQKRQILLVSLAEQVMRVYQQGRLVRSFFVTTGRQERPSLPGVWAVLARRAPVIFQSGEPKNSPYWFPDTPIEYALLYHLGGYFVHDAPWRASFGPGTQFPHVDPGGTTAYNGTGSHGCINLRGDDAAWVYKHTGWNTAILVY